ncbi:MAG: PEFG-CTERM sorting domain-containing protein [Thaumarchaeota archaeon]|nr:PEFG-CTERM sorting domain-containing protein [Nitrososphaerota archaeon]
MNTRGSERVLLAGVLILSLSSLVLSQTVGVVLAESDNEDQQAVGENKTASNLQSSDEGKQQSSGEGEQQNKVQNGTEDQSNDSTGVQGELNAENNNTSVGTEGEVEKEIEVEKENNNEKATHNETERDSSSIDDAKKDQTIAAQVDVNNEDVSTQSIDNNVSVKTEKSPDSVNITVNASSQTGPKVLLINLNSTTIDVASMKYLDVRYDGHPIAPAANVDQILHANSTDEPHYAILVTQSGAQILVSIPHFSVHSITIGSLSKVIKPVPEFGSTAQIVLVVAIIGIMAVAARKRNLRFLGLVNS